MAAQQILIWEDDPGSSGVLVMADKPNIGQIPFKYTFPPPRLGTSQHADTPQFRYWNAAGALRRGADFWGPKVGRGQWFRGPALGVRLDVGPGWNAGYDRQALNFYSGVLPTATIYAAASPDMLCHELGHAMLDAIEDLLWNTLALEIEAFHESFGDMSAILCSLQIPSMRDSVVASLAATGGSLYVNSRLSRIAEQFGTALHLISPHDADTDCLRNAVNPFCYCDPNPLPPSAHTTQLSSDRHSFSRIFTGALFEVLAGMLALYPSPTSAQLLKVAEDMRDIMVDAVKSAWIVPSYYAEVAAWMVQKSVAKNPAYPAIFRDVFIQRCILSLASASRIMASLNGEADMNSETVGDEALPKLAQIESSHYGLKEPLFVQIPGDAAKSIARSATPDGRSMDPASPEAAATAFVDQLFMKGLVNYGDVSDKDYKGDGGDRESKDPALAHTTHRLQREGKELHLIRIRFNCGPRHVCSKS
ncbi:hypothetical protein J2X72_000717 [Phyllobacterium sp. 1468]|uniref:hypothetical protein n=1 Tax=Phyllobacterium sp. 1468 TaxID=2817759 RepID=UPI002866C9E8|nr:hypothetical protein [Phyllobacterium sp. 1468]MDR6631946.1 hypothetical protein [Phyllobacterium sp. 1468]